MRIVLPLRAPLLVLTALAVLALGAGRLAADISRFVGDYTGTAVIQSADGSAPKRDMSVSIAPRKDGFNVKWTTITHKPDGKSSVKSYSVDFVESDRAGVYAAAMKKNVFGHLVQLDPMQGEPYVWARIIGDTLSVYSLFVDSAGGYEIQQFDRTLAEGGLKLDFKSVRNGEIQRTVSTFLARR